MSLVIIIFLLFLIKSGLDVSSCICILFLLLFYLLHFHKIHAVKLNTISGSQFMTNGDSLVSPNGTFKLGFFQPAGNSENIYLGILYNKVPGTTTVWVANRNHPLTAASPLVLKIDYPGVLVLTNNVTLIWSSNTTSTSGNVTAKLHDTGNLVLVDFHDKVMWQSFDYPTDTLLPGMKLGNDYLRGIVWRLTSWKSSQDPALGEMTWGRDTQSYPESKLKQGEVVKFRGGPWKNQRIIGASQFDRNLIMTFSVIITDKEVSFSYNLDRTSILSRVTLNSSGHLESFVRLEDGKNWQLALSLPMDVCDTYNICSDYGICKLDRLQQSCRCLDEKTFVPRNKTSWETGDWSGGCVRRTPLDCKNGSEGFIKYSNVKLPETKSSWFNMNMSLEECEVNCLNNCTCMAYANPDATLQGCVLWFNELIDIRVYSASNEGQDMFVRMASSELDGSLHISKNKEEDIKLPLFSFSTIATATASFSTKNKLGEGGFGLVFKGVLEGGLEIAVKRLSKTSNQGVNEFKNEVICISKLQHRNLVKLIGCCIEEDEKLLIYEYMPNKSLDSFIFDRERCVLLDWRKRFNIIIGIARGLHYLHHDSRLRIIHRDLKAGNILLDANMNPKISDFGLARSFGDNGSQANTQRVVGTYGYMPPEYARDGLFSIKSDVFSFGVLLLEIVSGKKNRGFIHPEHDNNLIGHAWSIYNEGRSMELLDDSLAESCHPPEVLRSIQVGLLCGQQNADDRPNMSSVITMLVGEGVLPKPKQPAFFIGGNLVVANVSSGVNEQARSINGVTFSELDAR
ncbi:hypothetical protein QVD17_06271 [Tagetes erecta]|uniref:Receptor-like serine/threonine-protein kinase n=1 Tax=Tagetes erecta TaxID=13708 RepID=A0AAD8LDN2_TARER|nr:hypothetical protein QVD17_06271 [Tagetes erecta]